MKHETLELMQRQLRPEAFLAALVAIVLLTVFAAHFYLLKPAFVRYGELRKLGPEASAEGTLAGVEAAATAIAATEKQLEALKSRLYGESSQLPIEKIESHVIDRLDHISEENEVQLVSVRPGEVSRVLMFDELPYEVEVTGDYFALFDWLEQVEQDLRPMVVNRFEMSPEAKQKRVSMRLRLVSYRPLGESA